MERKEESVTPALLSRLARGWSRFFVGQEENVASLLQILRRTVDKVYQYPCVTVLRILNDADTNTFSGTKYFRYRYQYFFRYQMFPIPKFLEDFQIFGRFSDFWKISGGFSVFWKIFSTRLAAQLHNCTAAVLRSLQGNHSHWNLVWCGIQGCMSSFHNALLNVIFTMDMLALMIKALAIGQCSSSREVSANPVLR